MENLNPETETNSSQVAKEGREYKIIKDGKGGEHKVINFDWEGYAPREGMVELVPLKFAKGYDNAIRHQNEASMSRMPDKKTGMINGIPSGFDKDGFILYKRLTVRGAEFLDLSDDNQRKKWICIKLGPFLKGSPNFQTQSKTVYESVDKEKQAVEFFKHRKLKRKATEIAESLHGQELIEVAIMIGKDPKQYSTTMLEMEVINFADNPEKINGKTGAERFLEAYNSDTKVELIVLKRGLSVGILTENLNQGINYNGISLGFTEFEAVNYLKNHPATLTSIDIQSRQKQDTSTQAFQPAKISAIKDEKDAVIERQRKELEEMQARLSKVSESALEAKAESDIASIDPELDELIKEAKRLLIPAPWLIGGKNCTIEVRKEKIQDKITEAKKKANN